MNDTLRRLAFATLLCIGAIAYEGHGIGATLSTPLPDTCAPTLAQDASGNFVVSCGGSGGGGTPPPPPPPPGPTSCPGFAATHIVPVTWGKTTQTLVAMGPDDALVYKFTVPSTAASMLKAGTMALVEYGSAPNPRFGTFSTQACDFAGTFAVRDSTGNPSVFCYENQPACSTQIGLSFTTNPLRTGAAEVVVGGTYYVNIGNQSGSCTASGVCDVLTNWGWPSR